MRQQNKFFVLIGYRPIISRLLSADYRLTGNWPVPYRCISNNYTGWALDSWWQSHGFNSQSEHCCTEQVVHTLCPSPSNLVPINGRWRSVAEKVTVVLALHWPWICYKLQWP